MEVHAADDRADAPVASAVAHGIRAVFDREPEYVISPGTYDQKHIARIGHLYDCIAYGPGILDLAHRPDEWVGIDDMVESAKVMALGAEGIAADADARRLSGQAPAFLADKRASFTAYIARRLSGDPHDVETLNPFWLAPLSRWRSQRRHSPPAPT